MNKVIQPKSDNFAKHRKEHILFIVSAIIIVFYGLFLRIYGLDLQSWWIDEAYSINAALSTIEKGYPILDSGWVYDGQIAFTYPLAAFIKVFGLHNWVTRLPSVIFNILFLGVIFQFCRRFFNKRVAVLVALFMALSYWEIAWARQARNYAMFQLSFWISLYYFWEILFNKFSYKNLSLWIGASIVTLFTHGLALLLLPIYGVTFIVVFWKRIIKENIQLLKNKAVIVVLLAALIISLIFKGKIISVLGGHTLPDFYRTNYIKFAIEHFKTTMLIGLLPLIVFYKQNLNKKTALLIIYYAIFMITATFFVNLPGHRYLFVVIPALYILAACGIDFLVKGKWWRKTALITILTFLLIISGEFKFTPSTNYFLESDPSPTQLLAEGKEPYRYYIYAPQPDWEGAYDYIKAHRTPDDIIISAQPVFNKLYLGDKGYWISYNLNGGLENRPKTDRYVDAETIMGVEDLEKIITNSHGHIIFDYLAIDGKIPNKILKYIEKSAQPVYKSDANQWSNIVIYKM